MKIELGESLIYSYLRQVKNCLVTQTNWKASGNWSISDGLKDSVSYEFDKIKNHHAFSDMFKTDFNQTLKQTEIDVLGVSGEKKVYAIEVAFHEAGLNYGSKIETRNRVFKKLLRGYLTLKYYFPEYHHTIAFASPKVNNATQVYIKEYFDVLNHEFSDENVSFEYYSNERFYEEILQKTLEKTTSEADSSELFSRAIKLLRLSESFASKAPILQDTNTITPIESTTNIPTQSQNIETTMVVNTLETITVRGVEIEIPPAKGQVFQNYIRKAMRKLLNQNLLTDIEIIYLQDSNYCKREFDLAYPLLRTDNQNPDVNGYQRYWTTETYKGYMVCNDWYPNRRNNSQYEKFKAWLVSLDKDTRLSA